MKTKFKLKQVGGDINYKEFGGVFASKKLSNGEFDYWLFVELLNMEEATGDKNTDNYMIIIKAVSPSQVSEEKKYEALESFGLEDKELNKIEPLKMAYLLNEEGIGADLYSEKGNNAEKLLKKAREECLKISVLFGFYMDKPCNMLGNTGWDFIKGQIGITKN